jgi:drug/metabolite transporter (DMT)-like permease
MTTTTLAPVSGRNRVLGYSLYLTAALLFAFNGTISKAILLTGISGARLTQVRVTVAFLLLLVAVAIIDRRRLRIRRDEWLPLLVFGIGGVAMTQWLYFVAIARLPVGVALIIEFTAPIWVALWIRFGLRQPVRATVWAALGLAMIGLAMVAQIWQGFALDTVGALAALGAAVALALYFLLGERQSHPPFERDAVSLTMWGFGAATLFWAISQPWWSFPWQDLQGTGSPLGVDGPSVDLWALTGWMVVLGTLTPFLLIVMALHHLTAAQASVVGLTEPLLASVVAWLALGEVLSLTQILGGVVVITAVVIAERSR